MTKDNSWSETSSFEKEYFHEYETNSMDQKDDSIQIPLKEHFPKTPEDASVEISVSQNELDLRDMTPYANFTTIGNINFDALRNFMIFKMYPVDWMKDWQSDRIKKEQLRHKVNLSNTSFVACLH
jgi:hypothetical protein